MQRLLNKIRQCDICRGELPNKPKPILQAHQSSRILIMGQAPGQKVQDTGVPWQDKSGDELRRWLDVTEEQFYNAKLFGHVPMGFCYPGKGKSGDLPPRPECQPEWHPKLFDEMNGVGLTILIGQYAQKCYLKKGLKKNLTETVRAFEEFLPEFFPLVHPSPRNRIWQKKNPWFEAEVVPYIQKKVSSII